MDVYRLDRSDNRNIAMLLMRLTADERLAWLQWCCHQVAGASVAPGTVGEVGEVQMDWQMLCSHAKLNAERSVIELDRRVRATGRPLLLTASGGS